MNLTELRARHRDFILATATSHGVSDIRVFGSVARGDAGPDSDVDLLVHTGEEVSLLTLVRLERLLGERVGRPVQIISDGGLSPLLRKIILDEATML